MWEILTFGARPYKERKPHEMLQYLESGQRLVQPPTCTIDLYQVLLKCETKSNHTPTCILPALLHLLTLCDNLLDHIQILQVNLLLEPLQVQDNNLNIHSHKSMGRWRWPAQLQGAHPLSLASIGLLFHGAVYQTRGSLG